MKSIAFTTVLIIFFASTYLLGRIIGTYIFYDSCIAGSKFEYDVFRIGIECSTPLRIALTIGMGLFYLFIILSVVKLIKKLLRRLFMGNV